MGDGIVIRGARQHNLVGVDLELPRDRLIVLTGLSGSGKSSLAFDTLYAEGQRRYVESLSAYARQFLEQMEKPDVDSIEGLSPAIAIEQKGMGRSPRSTVGTVTEVHDFLRLLFARVGEPHCPDCGRPIASQTIPEIADRLLALPEGTRIELLAPVVRGRKGAFRRELDTLRREGFVRARIDGEVRELDEALELDRARTHVIEVVVDRIAIRPKVSRRLADSLEVALRTGDGLCRVLVHGDDPDAPTESVFSQRFACPDCGVSLPELSPRFFSFNSPYGACRPCSGLGVISFFDPTRIVADATRTLRQGAIAPWGTKPSATNVAILAALGRALNFDLDTPFGELPEATRTAILEGTGDDEVEFVHEREGRAFRTRRPFEGVVGLLERRLREEGGESEPLAVFRTSQPCTACGGSRLRPEARAVTLGDATIVDVANRTIDEAIAFFDGLVLGGERAEIARRPLAEIRSRLGFLTRVGLGYLSLDRAATTLSGGEAQRLRLATQIGSRLVGVLYVLDEPSIGLHPRDTARLLAVLLGLRDLGNTVVVVEHDRDTILAADHVVDLGPGAGELGGRVVAEGPPSAIAAHPESITGAFLSGRRKIPVPTERRRGSGWSLRLRGARGHNLQGLDVDFPIGAITCVTGVSGSGKSTLVLDTLVPALAHHLHGAHGRPEPHDGLENWQLFDKVIGVDQAPIGRTPRSNPATYTGVFGPIRELFAATSEARVRGWGPGRFSFNVKGGRCESCRGDGLVRIEMHFLPDVYVSCEACGGRRYDRETLEATYRGKSVADVLEMTIAEALAFFEAVPPIRTKLDVLVDVGVGYLRLGQSATTLSGGEAQRIKLARELARRSSSKTIYVLDEPTTGLHFADVEVLLRVLGRLADGGATVVVIEHDLDVVKCADWVVDLGPEGGSGGGRLLAVGTPEQVARVEGSHTGRALLPLLS